MADCSSVNLSGHLAVAYLLGRRRSDARLERAAWIAGGAILPDVIDKSAMLVGLTPYGRTVGHSASLWALLLLGWIWARARGLSRAPALGLITLGGVSHLLVDLVDDVFEGFERTGYAFSAWAGWPHTNPDMWSVQVPHLWPHMRHPTTTLELLTVALLVFLLARDRVRGGAAA